MIDTMNAEERSALIARVKNEGSGKFVAGLEDGAAFGKEYATVDDFEAFESFAPRFEDDPLGLIQAVVEWRDETMSYFFGDDENLTPSYLRGFVQGILAIWERIKKDVN